MNMHDVRNRVPEWRFWVPAFAGKTNVGASCRVIYSSLMLRCSRDGMSLEASSDVKQPVEALASPTHLRVRVELNALAP
jgi:hypothetical protein